MCFKKTWMLIPSFCGCYSLEMGAKFVGWMQLTFCSLGLILHIPLIISGLSDRDICNLIIIVLGFFTSILLLTGIKHKLHKRIQLSILWRCIFYELMFIFGSTWIICEGLDQIITLPPDIRDVLFAIIFILIGAVEIYLILIVYNYKLQIKYPEQQIGERVVLENEQQMIPIENRNEA